MPSIRTLALSALIIVAATISHALAADSIRTVRPSEADPSITEFDQPNVIIGGGTADKATPLAIFLPGTGGRPENVLPLLRVVAGQGYRVIGLSYDDVPAVAQICPLIPDPDCSRAFREMRVFGDGRAPVANPVAEAVAPRLASLLRYLAQTDPQAGWGGYLEGGGQPVWRRILVSGLSQGAGMAALIAKKYPVYRVVLFSSPWDTAGQDHHPAPWLSTDSATPPERWWAERHAREKTTDLIGHAYRALGIPADHILIFDGPLPPGLSPNGPNPYHGATVRDIGFAEAWRRLYGTAGALPAAPPG